MAAARQCAHELVQMWERHVRAGVAKRLHPLARISTCFVGFVSLALLAAATSPLALNAIYFYDRICD
jgi:hypothetical protein